jgi:hypothetical protein
MAKDTFDQLRQRLEQLASAQQSKEDLSNAPQEIMELIRVS